LDRLPEVLEAWGEPVRFSRKSASEFIPTWQRGRPQPTDDDIGNFSRAGYSKNSLIYSCIREIATSFADLPAQVLRPNQQRVPEPVPDHALVTLLENPNEAMDGYEFKVTLASHFQATGNAYVEKVRRSENATRNRVLGPVKELGLLRPDYVQIAPGARRAEDAFVVSVNGQEIKRLPRADVIHLRTPNLINDFYGLSPIAVLVNEGNVDTEMTAFDWAFFRNAGVPVGILTTETRHSPDEVKEIKGAFRRMFGGVKKWFELLVLNAQEAKYQQLGLAIKDMEMPGTRAFVESRICAVFGVPPIIVGALVGLEKATYSNYEQAQQSFWSETMVPFAASVGSVLTRELLPEFATTADRGARVAFDNSGVKALQEDHSDRLKTANELIRSGGLTVNQALQAVGLPAIDGADFYVRAINQVIETPVPARIGGRAAMATLLDSKADVGNRRQPREKLADRAAEALERFFAEQAERVVGRLPKGQKQPNDLLPTEEERLLLFVLQAFWDQAVEEGWRVGSLELELPDAFDPLDPNVRRLLADAGERIVQISDETRKQVQDALLLAREQGLSPKQTAKLIRDLDAFSSARALRIARTELAIADNKGAIARYRDGGVTRVRIFDGPGCGWTRHDDSDTANGSIRSLDDLESYPVAHPNCVRSRAPIVE